MGGSQKAGTGIQDAELVEVADRVYAYVQPDGSWFINNTGFVVGEEGVIGIDACSTRRRTQALLGTIASVTRAPVRTLVNTHHHGDHTFGNSVFGPAVTIVGHEDCRTEMLAAGVPGSGDDIGDVGEILGSWDPVDWGNLSLAPPTVTFSEGLRLWSDTTPLEVTYVGRPAHTSNDSLVWLPEQQVLFCGDLLFSGGTPFALMGSVSGAVTVLREVVAPLPARVIVPGHGSPCDSSLIETVAGYLEFVIDVARRGMEAGLSPLDVARETDLGEYDGWLDGERIVGNLHRAYADLDPVGSPVDVPAAIRDMVIFNGDKPLSCHV